MNVLNKGAKYIGRVPVSVVDTARYGGSHTVEPPSDHSEKVLFLLRFVSICDTQSGLQTNAAQLII